MYFCCFFLPFSLDRSLSVSSWLHLDYALADSCLCRQINREAYGHEASDEIVTVPRICCHFLVNNEVMMVPRIKWLDWRALEDTLGLFILAWKDSKVYVGMKDFIT